MPQDRYYRNICKKCEGFEECEPRNEENIRDCRQKGNMKITVRNKNDMEETMKKKLSWREKRRLIDEWAENNGAAKINLKTRDIILFDGGLFSIEKYVEQIQKRHHMKKLPNGCREIVFTKKKYPHEYYKAVLWFEELDETIRYLRSMRRLLKSLGYRTG